MGYIKDREKFIKETVDFIENRSSNIKILDVDKIENMQSIVTTFCNIHNSNWRGGLYVLKRGACGCTECSKEKTASKVRYTLEEVIEKVNNKNSKIEIIIKDYKIKNKKTKLDCKCIICGYKWSPTIDSLVNTNNGCARCNKREKKDSEVVCREIEEINPDITVVNRTFKNKKSKTLCRCKIHNDFTWEASIPRLLDKRYKSKCPICSGKIVSDINRMSVLYPENIKYLKNKNDAFNNSAFSHKYFDLICPDCGMEKRGTLGNLNGYGFSCNICGDGFSIPEKFVRNILYQLNIKFQPEHKPKSWIGIGDRRYDIFSEEHKFVIEVHGEQHYLESSKFKMSLKETKENDLYKKNIAISNGFNYIEVDARNSSYDWLRKSTEESLKFYFNLENINWESAYNITHSSLKIKCWDMWNNGFVTRQISEELGVVMSTVNRWLLLGSKLNKVEYNSKESKIKSERHIRNLKKASN